MKKHNNNEQNKRNKVSNDLSSYLPTEKGGKIQDLAIILALLKSQDKDGRYHLQNFDQAIDLVPEPLFVEQDNKYISGNLVIRDKKKVCVDSQELQANRWEAVKAIYRTFFSSTTGFPEYLAEKYQPRFNPKQLVELINKELEHGNPAVRSRSHQMIGY